MSMTNSPGSLCSKQAASWRAPATERARVHSRTQKTHATRNCVVQLNAYAQQRFADGMSQLCVVCQCFVREHAVRAQIYSTHAPHINRHPAEPRAAYSTPHLHRPLCVCVCRVRVCACMCGVEC